MGKEDNNKTINLTSHEILGVSMEWMLFAIQDCGLQIKNITPCNFADGAITVQTESGDWHFAHKGDKYVCAGFTFIRRSFDLIPSMYP